MQIRELHIRNFRVYEGDHRVKLVDATAEKNVYLFGGFNGAGKTSLFSAIALAFYGRDAAGLVFDRHLGDDLESVYRRYLQDSFTFAARARGDSEMIISLDLIHEGEEIRITRTWWFEDGLFADESLVVYRNREPLRIEVEVPEERIRVLQEFIEGIAPARIAKFFFFDGEEIKQIAEREPDQAVVEGLNQLLGFHALRRLTEDLTTLQGKMRRELPSSAESGLLSATSELHELKTELSETENRQRDAQALHDSVEADLAAVEADLHHMFGGHAVKDRNDALDLVAQRQRDLASLSAEIQSFVADVLTLSLPGKLFDKVARRSKAEIRRRRAADTRKHMKPLEPELRNELFGSSELRGKLTQKQRSSLRKAWKDAWQYVIERSDEDLDETLSLLATDQLEILQRSHAQIRDTGRRELVARIARRDHLEREIERLQSATRALEVDSRAEKLLGAKSNLLEKRLNAGRTIEDLQRDAARLRQEVSTKEAIITRLEGQLADADLVAAELDAADRLKRAAESFMVELRKRRTASLAKRTTEMIRRLAHKEELVHAVQIDPEDFGIRILDRSGEEILNPSAGEREVFALALVWGLAQISNRQLPVMIDTPLGRLDQMHRANFVERFLPVAGEQVIVLSTDSEIDRNWHDVLLPHLAQRVLINFSDERQSSEFVDDAYFDVAPAPSEVTT